MNRGQRGNTPSSLSNTSFGKTHGGTAPRSPIKTSHFGKGNQELGLTLRRVIGTTCEIVTCFDCLPQSRAFAYTAGAAAVVATIDGQGNISQRFYRANPVQNTPTRSAFPNGIGRDSPSGIKASLQGREARPSHSPRGVEWSDSPTSQQGSAKERVKAATTLSFSQNGRYIAVGETGYKPRVLIFSLDDKAPQDVPVAVIPEHTFGVQAVAFSQDSKYLASFGATNDGFLYVWNIDERTGAASLLGSNKCTNVVRQMAWIGQNLITAGVRFVKVWRPNELPASLSGTSDQKFAFTRGHRPLAGRNAVLGDLIEATFTCAVPFSEEKAIICTDGGDICLLDDSDKNQKLTRVANVNFSITAACLDSTSRLLVTGSDGSIKAFDIGELENACLPASIPPGSFTPGKGTSIPATHFVAIGAVAGLAVTVDNKHGIQLRHLPGPDGEEQPTKEAIRELPAHSDAVLGVRALPMPNHSNAAFLTWSAGGTVIFWSTSCRMKATIKVPMSQSVDMYNIANELKTVTACSSVPKTISGDRYGMLRVSDTETGAVCHGIRAHSGEITDIAISEDSKHTLVATSSRDRTIQLFALTSDGLDLLQTLDEHAGSVTCVTFAKRGSQLLSCSSDRTIVVREAVHRGDDVPAVFVITRTITLKNSPTSIRLSLYEDVILLSATDRCIQLVNTLTGRIMSSFKASDTEGGEAVVMSSLAHLPSSTGSPIIAGVSSSDKSIRLYSEDGLLLARDWGHTEGVTDIAVIQPPGGADSSSAKIVTVAADGTIFVWNTMPGRPTSSDSDQGLQVPGGGFGLSSAAPPLRKVISHSEMRRFQRSNSIDTGENEPLTPAAAAAQKAPTGLRHKNSRLTVKATPRLDPSPLASHRLNPQSPTQRRRSPSPASPTRLRQVAHIKSRPARSTSVSTPGTEKAVNHGSSNKSESSGFGSVTASTEQLARTLKAYRQRLEKSCTSVPCARLGELESELELTMTLVKKIYKAKKSGTADVAQELDKMSIHSRSSSGEVEATEAPHIDGGEDVTPRKRVNTNELICTSPQELSFVSADSHQSDGVAVKDSEEVQGGAERDV